MTEGATATRMRIRWGWFFGCILLGVAGILIGLLIAPTSDRPAYLAGVLSSVGTTLLLVGIVLLLEQRIVDTAVRAVRDAAEQARLRSDEVLRTQVRDLEDRIEHLWATSAESAGEAARKQAETRRMTGEFISRVVDDYADEGEESSSQ